MKFISFPGQYKGTFVTINVFNVEYMIADQSACFVRMVSGELIKLGCDEETFRRMVGA